MNALATHHTEQHSLYGYGAAFMQSLPPGQDAMFVANGFDHTPQHATKTLLWECSPKFTPSEYSARALYYTDVAVVERELSAKDGEDGEDGSPEPMVVLSALADEHGCIDTGGLYDWSGRCLVAGDEELNACGGCGVPALSLAVGDMDGDGRLDLVVGSLISSKYQAPEREPLVVDMELLALASSSLFGLDLSPRGDDPAMLGLFAFPFSSPEIEPPLVRLHSFFEHMSAGPGLGPGIGIGPGIDAGLGTPTPLGIDASEHICANPPAEPSTCPCTTSAQKALTKKENRNGDIRIYLQDGEGGFRFKKAIRSHSPAVIRLSDLDRDGRLDILAAGFDVDIVLAPLEDEIRVKVPPLKDDSFSQGIDLLQREDDLVVAVTEGKANEGDHNSFDSIRVWTYPCPKRGHCELQRIQTMESVNVCGMPSDLRFTRVDPERGVELVVGRMAEKNCTNPIFGTCIGAPLVGLRGPNFTEWRELNPVMEPSAKSSGAMSARLEPFVLRRHSELNVPREECFVDGEATEAEREECREAAGVKDACRELLRPTLSLPGELAFVTEVEVTAPRSNEEVRSRHVAGERHLTVGKTDERCVRVRWREIVAPSLFVTSASPLAGSGRNLFMSPF